MYDQSVEKHTMLFPISETLFFQLGFVADNTIKLQNAVLV